MNKFSRQHDLQVRRKTLSIGQDVLYRLLVRNLEEKKTVDLKQIERIYIAYGCRHIDNGLPCSAHWVESGGNWILKKQPMDDWQLERASKTWLAENIGRLFLKGYLKATPTIGLRELDEIRNIKPDKPKQIEKKKENKK